MIAPIYYLFYFNKSQHKQTETMTTQTQTSFGYSDAKSKSIVWAAYAEHFAGEEIQEEGFNMNSGNVYIALENGVTIASAFGQSVDFYVYDFDNDDELGFDSIDELNEYLQNK